ncbi:hypothetical protein ES703_59618 [subsurface metagenome]|uniref:Uncharacterized protein n=1 Tax=marine sediment metagenome TaxID=412755 RepID=X1QQ76_9ZZZZ
MKCYRVWFMDGSAMLVDASNEDEAIDMAEHKAKASSFKRSYSSTTAKRVECLDTEEVKP